MDYIERHHKIMDRVKLHYDYAVRHYGRENVLGVFLYGSQNYQCDNDTADVDTKCILIPDLYHLAIRPYEVKHLHIPRESGEPEVCECMTLMHMVANWKKQNPNFLEVMFTHFFVINPTYEDFWWDYIDCHRESIARYDVRNGILSVAHQALSTIKRDPLDGKRIGNGYRLYHLLCSYEAGRPYLDCLIPPSMDCEMIKRLKAGKEPVQVLDGEILMKQFDEMIDKYKNMEMEANHAVSFSMENFILEMIERRIHGEE